MSPTTVTETSNPNGSQHGKRRRPSSYHVKKINTRACCHGGPTLYELHEPVRSSVSFSRGGDCHLLARRRYRLRRFPHYPYVSHLLRVFSFRMQAVPRRLAKCASNDGEGTEGSLLSSSLFGTIPVGTASNLMTFEIKICSVIAYSAAAPLHIHPTKVCGMGSLKGLA